VLQKLEIVEPATHLRGRSRVLVLLAADAVQLVARQQALLYQLGTQHLHLPPLQKTLVFSLLLAPQTLLL